MNQFDVASMMIVTVVLVMLVALGMSEVNMNLFSLLTKYSWRQIALFQEIELLCNTFFPDLP